MKGVFYVSDLSSKPIYEEALDKLWLINRPIKGQLPKKVKNIDKYQKEIIFKRGDVVRLGRVMLRVKDYRIENAINPEDKKGKVCDNTPVDLQDSKCVPK